MRMIGRARVPRDGGRAQAAPLLRLRRVRRVERPPRKACSLPLPVRRARR